MTLESFVLVGRDESKYAVVGRVRGAVGNSEKEAHVIFPISKAVKGTGKRNPRI